MVDGGGKPDDTIVTSEPLIIPQYQVPERAIWGISASLVAGFGMGSIRAFRKTGLRFLAENAHRAPTTVGGWYFYNKTKSYKQFSAGLIGGLKQSVKLGGMTLVWFALDDSMQETGARPVSNIVASLALGGAFAAFQRTPWKTTQRILGCALLVGSTLQGLKWLEEYMREMEKARNGDGEAER